MRVLGVDGGMTRLGLGVVHIDSTYSVPQLISHGLIYHPRDPEQTFNQHLNSGIAQITTAFPKLLDATNPHIIVSEYIPAGKLGANDSLVIAAVTACKVIAFQFGIPWYDIAASSVKKQLTGDGRATKAVVRNTVLDLFPLVDARHKQLKAEQKEAGEKAEGLPQDVFDALGIAVIGARVYGKDEVREVQPDAPQDTVQSD